MFIVKVSTMYVAQLHASCMYFENWHSCLHRSLLVFKAKKVDKPKISRLIVSALRCANPPSRFLRCNDDTNQWEDVGDKRAAEKVSQTLREKEKTEKDRLN